MSHAILDSFIAQYQRYYEFLIKFIDISDDKLWTDATGGFPAWMHIYHVMELTPLFLAPGDIAPKQDGLYPWDVVRLANTSVPAPSKEDMLKVCRESDIYAHNYFGTLTDADLPNPHAGFSKRIAPATIAGVLCGYTGHMLYHLGYLDAILKTHGKDTIF